MDKKYAKLINAHSYTLGTLLESKDYSEAVTMCNMITELCEKIKKEIESGKAETEQHETLPAHILELMKKQIDSTESTGLEHGFTMCDKGQIEIAEQGENNHISLKKCPGISLLFHTHPCGTPTPSEQDLESIKDIPTVQKTCIGTSDAVRCYTPEGVKIETHKI